ncbi:terpenoid cyclases/protein prenyltransferase alpha-alpha toroid [Podospora fimiseda]|uniref:Terpenoid cyclases/protein prenyltransferase alpha-alpha toroid n=1 Tax=Podospora fimiseda TaxID=252190 RepID=A0AAN7BTB4_9PEZI|nr:terpenoid cyclases/protein prenyltransferase alpha-alpha toroid [Podospora fimiseda]
MSDSIDIPRHLKYWKMCLSTPLPHHYLPNEGNRLALAYFIVNSIIILTPPDTPPESQLIPPKSRAKLRSWVLSHQHPDGGFCPSSSLVFPLHGYQQYESPSSDSNSYPGMANIPGTIFALQLLALLADDNGPEGAFNGVDRVKTLKWLRRLQRPDGSFGEVLRQIDGTKWEIMGGYDMRYCYIAASIRWMLRGDGEDDEDFDVEGLKRYILSSQTYDGGFAASSEEEPHAGYAYCAISALSLLDRPLETGKDAHESEILNSGIKDMPGLVHWLASRQFVYLEPTPPNEDDSSDTEEEDDVVNFLLPSTVYPTSENPLVASNGRTNKVADTCYSWWVGAALANLTKTDLFNWKDTRRFLLEKMTHRIGGFSKYPGGPPDVYHSCFGLTAMAVMKEPGLRELDSALAVPIDTVKVIEKARAKLLRTARTSTTRRDVVEMGLRMIGDGKRPVWLK